MDPLDTMGILAELSISVVGFTGVVIALQRRSSEPLRASVMNMLFGFGFSGVVWAVLPQVLLGAGVDDGMVWRSLSAAFATTMLVLGIVRRRQARRVGASLGQLGTAVPILALCQLSVLLADTYFASASLFLAALLSNLSIGIILFWRLIDPAGAPLGGSHPDSD